MKCQDAREAMLTAEPMELAGIGDTPLAAHVRGCGRCMALARGLAGDLDALSAAVDGQMPRRVRRAVLAVALPIAAAAVVMLAWRRDTTSTPVHLRAPAVVSVQVEPGQNAAVFATKDPKVTVVWLTSGGGAP